MRAEMRELIAWAEDAPANPASSHQLRLAIERLDTLKLEQIAFALSNPVFLDALLAIEVLPFDVGDRVEKTGGDYAFVGYVVAVFRKHASDEMRVVVENAERLIHIFHPRQLRQVAQAITTAPAE